MARRRAMGSDPAGLTPSDDARGGARGQTRGLSPGAGRPRQPHPARVPAGAAHLRPEHHDSLLAPAPASASRRSTRWAPPPTARSRRVLRRSTPAPRPAPTASKVRGPHKPTLDEMGPHAERGLPVAGKPLPSKPPGQDHRRPSTSRRRKSTATAAPGRPAGRGGSLPPSTALPVDGAAASSSARSCKRTTVACDRITGGCPVSTLADAEDVDFDQAPTSRTQLRPPGPGQRERLETPLRPLRVDRWLDHGDGHRAS